MAAEFLAAVGDARESFISADQLAAFVGPAPTARDSEKRADDDRRMRGGNSTLNWVFYQAAFASLRSFPTQLRPPAGPKDPLRTASPLTKPTSMARALHDHRWTTDTQSLRHRRWHLTRLSSSFRGSPWGKRLWRYGRFLSGWPNRFRTHQHGFVLQESGLWDYVSEAVASVEN